MKGLDKADLIVDQIYGGSRNGNASDDPLPKLLGVDNSAGFRHLGKRPNTETLKLLVLKSNFNDHDWPDNLDRETGVLTYYGDNKKVADIHDTPRQGNLMLNNLFRDAADVEFTEYFPPVLVFGGTGEYRDVQFLGLAVPGTSLNSLDDELAAVWRTKKGDVRYQNYRSTFSILDVPIVTRSWIDDMKIGEAASSSHAPQPWLNWLRLRKYQNLMSPRTLDIRQRDEQLPRTKSDEKILNSIHTYFMDDPYSFEVCAVEIAKLVLPEIDSADVTQRYRDGGRDATGKYRIGGSPLGIQVEFSLEAKCYAPSNPVGVKELSRLISRLRHRQFGILVTTSYLAKQAYQELKEDQHPIIVLSGLDIVQVLKQKIGNSRSISLWLDRLSK